MHPLTAPIREAIAAAQPELLKIPPPAACLKPAPDAWSRNEILGHLIDSAAHNHQLVVRGALDEALNFPPYQQDPWVAIQRYNQMDWLELVDLFVLNNRRLCWVVEGLPPQAFANLCRLGKDKIVPLEFVVTDYLRHLKLHLASILESS